MDDDSSSLYFATSGIRGKANTVIGPDLALRVGKAIAKLVNEDSRKSNLVYVGFDNRRNSLPLAYTLLSGLTSFGVNVKIFDQPIPTPMLIHATISHNAVAGVMITGSHLPAYDNGIILVDGKGNYYKGDLSDNSEEPVSWANLGNFEIVHKEKSDYIEFIQSFTKSIALTKVNLKVLLDPVHGPLKDYLFNAISPFVDSVFKMNWTDDDSFPGRVSEPTPNNLANTRSKLLEESCDLGIATDMDGDRVIFITKSGKIISGDYTGAIFASMFWEKDESPIIAPVNSSAILELMKINEKSKIHYCRVGPPSIIEAIYSENAKFGFEESGKYIFRDYAIWPDAIITSLMLLKLLEDKKKSLDEIILDMPQLSSLKTKVEMRREVGFKLFETIKTITAEKQLKITSMEEMDGLRLNFEDKSWILLRQSGTEDFMRIFTEHSKEEKAKQLNELGKSIINEAYYRYSLEI